MTASSIIHAPDVVSDSGNSAQILSLSHLTIVDAHPLELVEAAYAGGFNAIGLRIHRPMPTDAMVPVVGKKALIRDICLKKDDLGIQVLDAEAFWLTADTDIALLEPALETAAVLNATNILVVGNDPQMNRLTENYGKLCSMADKFGLTAALEFISYCKIDTLQAAKDLVQSVGQPNARFLIDALHLMRSGGTPSDLETIDPQQFSYCQLADFKGDPPKTVELLRHEARTDRKYPGTGDAPLAELLERLPDGLPLGVEAPDAQYAHLSPVERGRLCGNATRSFLKNRRVSP